MTEEAALYIRDGDAFVGTQCTAGSWHANGQSGGAVLALLGHVIEDVPTLTATPDVSGHLSRAPVGEWVAISGHTYYAHAVAHGVSMGVLSDEVGVFGITSTSQLLDPVETHG